MGFHYILNPPRIKQIQVFKIKLIRITFRCSSMDDVNALMFHVSDICMQCKEGKEAKIWNQYNQVPHLTQDTVWENDKKHQIQESQEVSPFPAGDHKAA